MNTENPTNKAITVLIATSFLIGTICLFAALMLMRGYDPNKQQIDTNIDIEWNI